MEIQESVKKFLELHCNSLLPQNMCIFIYSPSKWAPTFATLLIPLMEKTIKVLFWHRPMLSRRVGFDVFYGVKMAILILGSLRARNPMALNPANREVGGEVGYSILRAMSVQQSVCGREHWRDGDDYPLCHLEERFLRLVSFNSFRTFTHKGPETDFSAATN